MPDENRFAGLSEAEKEAKREQAAEEEEPAEESEESSDSGGPAFEFDATTAKSIYVRPKTLERLEDTEFEVEMLLRRNEGIRDVTGREFHDAAVRVLEENAEEVVEQILEERGSEY
jgi:hypothetical protein